MHMHVKVLKRSSGHNMIRKAAYNSRSNLQDITTGEHYYHRSKGGLVTAEILFPDNSPCWLQQLTQDREAFWTEVERREGRKDAQLAREVELSLPHELSEEQNISLLRSFVQKEFVAQGMIADMAIHRPPKGGDSRNIHGHVLLSMREISEDGFSLKVREWNDRNFVTKIRKRWAKEVNDTLERYGFERRFDHRSHENRNIDSPPQKYQGKAYRSNKQSRSTDKLPLNINEVVRGLLNNTKTCRDHKSNEQEIE